MRGRWTFAIVLLSASMAGCAGAKHAATDPSAAPPATVDEETGALVGIVFDSELTPVAGVNVSLDNGASANADDTGSFTINGLAAGRYAVTFRHEGYATVSKDVDIAPSEVTQMRVELPALGPDQDYHWSFSKVGLVRIGQWSLQYVQHLVNQSAVDAVFCDPCSYPVTLQPGIVDALTEAQYARASAAPGINEYVTLAYSVAQTTGGSLKLLMTHDFTPKHSYLWTPGQVRELRGYEKVRLEFHGPDMEPPGLLVNQKVEVWQTFAHGKPLPQGFSLLPT